MSGGCVDMRKRWDNLVGKSQEEAIREIKLAGEEHIEVVLDDTPESSKPIKSGVVRIIIDKHKIVKYPPLRQN